MKKVLTIAFAALLTFGLSNTAFSQINQEGDIIAGGGLTFTTGVGTGEIGITGGGYYSITDDIRAGASLSLFFGDFSPTQFNIDGHYLFVNDDDMAIYGLAGIGYWSWSFDFGGFGSTSVSTTGINLGAGLDYELDSITLFGEAKVTTIGDLPFNLTGGVRFRF